MAELEHFSHGCALTPPDIVAKNVCNICYKDEPVEFSCKPCNFDLCKACSKLPQKVSHDFHPDHLLEFHLAQFDRKPGHVICSGCGDMCSGSFYECKECEVYLDLSCALLMNILTCWNAEPLPHYSHRHVLRRSRPGPDARGSCILCELPLSPSAICYGCVHCYMFFHERCIDLPTEIQHPVHPAHSLKRLDYIYTCGDGINCSACGHLIDGSPFGCPKCKFYLHMRCADSLLRGLLHKSHRHRLFFVDSGAEKFSSFKTPCQICMRSCVHSLDSYYKCVECCLDFHFECLDIPHSVVKKSCHIHPLVCKIRFLAEDDAVEYCGVCETMVNTGHHAYSCKECDFLGHIECILHEEVPSPMFLKDLYSSTNQENTRPTNVEDFEPSLLIESELMINDVGHIHVMRHVDMSDLDGRADCNICDEPILDSPYKCETCSFWTHNFCAELGKPLTHWLHLNHPLTLSRSPTEKMLFCAVCEGQITGFNLFCRICDFTINISCALQGKHSLGVLGLKFMGILRQGCMRQKHMVSHVYISRSYPQSCTICDEIMYGRAVSCMRCEEIYHLECYLVGRLQRLLRHPLHSNHWLEVSHQSGSTCVACKLSIIKYCYHCSTCEVNFHIECINAVNTSGKARSHSHNLYNFWIDDLNGTRVCNVCAQTCGASFYGCIDCNFNAHVECIGFPDKVKIQQHQHTLSQQALPEARDCSLCGSRCYNMAYSCNHCKDIFHMKCIMPTSDREAATEEEQCQDIYLMSLERNLFDMFGETES
ncbi:unnamed protein product [Microthlaspi erraticum]|uniref:Phorbol-ester/DAG-type domain-containing protein n=1 Tax=Microthlaspi erraticum TaxID=1685480 RepID=A0A6D2JM43_9BRAS|nr:unnamed protein product [Microthlaspi erraticum]